MQDERPKGPVVEGWSIPPVPEGAVLQGRYASLEPLNADAHAALMYQAFDGHDRVWDYMGAGPFSSSAQFYRWMIEATARDDMHFYAIRDLDSGEWGGFAAYLRVKPTAGAIEIGFIAMAPRLQRTRAATEAIYLMMRWAFEAGYRRCEWKCDALNRPSRRAGQRLGFSYEGIFRQAMLVKGRNRDTAWFAVIDREWPALDEAFHLWLDPGNFDESGQQRERLSDLTALVRDADDPTL